MNKLLHRLAPAAVLGLPLLTLGQQSVDPADPRAAAQPLQYRSAFTDYTSWHDIKRGDWRQLNDDVRPRAGAAGAHAAHGTPNPGAQAASAPAPTPGASAPAMPARQGHPMHGGKP